MNKRIFSLLCILAVVLVFAFTAQTASISWNALAEDSTTAATSKKPAQEEPYVEPSTSATTTTQPPMPTTSSTTKKEEDSSTTKPTESSTDPTSQTKPTDPTQPTDKPPVSEQPGTTNQEPTSEKDTTKAPGTSTTTKRGEQPGKTTKVYVPTTTRAPRMSIPVVENTTIEGTTLSPLDAYFERISGDSNTYVTSAFEETQTQPDEEEKEHKPLSTIALVAICLGGIALVTVILTAAFAIRNKHAADDDSDSYDTAEEYEKNAYDGGSYDQPATDDAKQARPQVDESESFTVVSLDDNDYTD